MGPIGGGVSPFASGGMLSSMPFTSMNMAGTKMTAIRNTIAIIVAGFISMPALYHARRRRCQPAVGPNPAAA
jgi:hypothetical protein